MLIYVDVWIEIIMNHPDTTEIVRDIAAQLESGMKVYLNIDTGETESFFGDSYCLTDDFTEWEQSFNKMVNSWSSKMLFERLIRVSLFK